MTIEKRNWYSISGIRIALRHKLLVRKLMRNGFFRASLSRLFGLRWRNKDILARLSLPREVCTVDASWWTTLLIAYGNPIKHYGNEDLVL